MSCDEPVPAGVHGAVPLPSYTVVYGGSFDPPHMGHQMACLYLLEALGAAHVWLVPTYSHAFEKALTRFEDRVTMCECMASFDPRISVNPIERELNQGGRTLALIQALQAAHPKTRLALAVGADIVSERKRWYRWDDIVASIPVVVVGREGYQAISGSGIQLPEVSSTEIRDRASRGLSLTGLVPLAVAEWIRAKGLYREVGPL